MNNTTKTDAEILKEIYKKSNLKRYALCEKALESKDFSFLDLHGHPYVKVTTKEISIPSLNIDDVIQELQKIKANRQDNEGPQMLYSYSDHPDSDKEIIMVSSKVYTMHNISICNVSDISYSVKSSLWKLKHQSNGNDAKKIRESIDKYRLTDEG
jgi:hypothetical protein